MSGPQDTLGVNWLTMKAIPDWTVVLNGQTIRRLTRAGRAFDAAQSQFANLKPSQYRRIHNRLVTATIARDYADDAGLEHLGVYDDFVPRTVTTWARNNFGSFDPDTIREITAEVSAFRLQAERCITHYPKNPILAASVFEAAGLMLSRPALQWVSAERLGVQAERRAVPTLEGERFRLTISSGVFHQFQNLYHAYGSVRPFWMLHPEIISAQIYAVTPWADLLYKLVVQQRDADVAIRVQILAESPDDPTSILDRHDDLDARRVLSTALITDAQTDNPKYWAVAGATGWVTLTPFLSTDDALALAEDLRVTLTDASYVLSMTGSRTVMRRRITRLHELEDAHEADNLSGYGHPGIQHYGPDLYARDTIEHMVATRNVNWLAAHLITLAYIQWSYTPAGCAVLREICAKRDAKRARYEAAADTVARDNYGQFGFLVRPD